MQQPLVKNAASESQVNTASDKMQGTRDRELNDVRHVLGSIQGRRLIWRYLETCGVFRTSFTGSSQTFFNEGERNIGLKLLADINEASPESYLTMLKESKGDF